MRVISIANQKGGCGKTTTAINLSACLSLKRRKVLLIDLDPQGHSATGLNIDTDALEKSIHHALGNAEGKRIGLDEVTVKIAENFDVAPSNIELSTFEHNLSKIKGRETRLREAIEDLNQPYDYLIIDCPPSLGLLIFNSLIASTEVFIPIIDNALGVLPGKWLNTTSTCRHIDGVLTVKPDWSFQEARSHEIRLMCLVEIPIP